VRLRGGTAHASVEVCAPCLFCFSWRVQANDERTAENRYDRQGVKERLVSCVGVSHGLAAPVLRDVMAGRRKFIFPVAVIGVAMLPERTAIGRGMFCWRSLH
jgi:hypothetical protein